VKKKACHERPILGLDLMSHDEPKREKKLVTLKDLTPDKDPQGGSLHYSKKPPLPIPPPGFLVSSQGAGMPERPR